MGLKLTYQKLSSDDIVIKKHNEFVYQNIFIFAPKQRLVSKTPQKLSELTDFALNGRNMVIFTSPNVNYFIRNLSLNYGVDFAQHQSSVTDHLLNENHNHKIVKSSKVLSSVFTKPFQKFQGILFQGITQIIDTHKFQMSYTLLQAEDSTKLQSKDGNNIENNEPLTLVSGYQSQNNTRIVINGSIDLCSDQFYIFSSKSREKYNMAKNRVFCKELFEWVTHKRSVVKLKQFKYLSEFPETQDNSESFRVRENISVQVEMSQILKNQEVKIKALDQCPIQVQLFMMKLQQRINLAQQSDFLYSGSIQIGSIQADCQVHMQRIQLFSILIASQQKFLYFVICQITVRHIHHDELDRFQIKASPFYASIWLSFLAFSYFLVIFIYSDFKKWKPADQGNEKSSEIDEREVQKAQIPNPKKKGQGKRVGLSASQSAVNEARKRK